MGYKNNIDNKNKYLPKPTFILIIMNNMNYNPRRLFFNNPLRSVIQLLFVVIFVVIVRYFWGFAGAHYVCPWALAEVPVLMIKLKTRLFFIWGIIIGIAGIAVTLVYPRVFCGWICPLGTLFEFLGNCGQKIGIHSHRIPHWLNEKMRIFSFGIIIILLVLTYFKGLLICQFACPAFWLCAMWKLSIPIVAIGFLILWLLLSVRVKRGFCRYVCPYGGLTSLFVPLSHFAVKMNLELCNNCGLCNKACPMGIDLTGNITVRSEHCIACNDCIKYCPKQSLYWGKRRKN
ncbi:hypothetical protein DRQ33_00135 [bacterium]|nr:MAG: hypothetical protein DRQ33_00135 [bacterium]